MYHFIKHPHKKLIYNLSANPLPSKYSIEFHIMETMDIYYQGGQKTDTKNVRLRPCVDTSEIFVHRMHLETCFEFFKKYFEHEKIPKDYFEDNAEVDDNLFFEYKPDRSWVHKNDRFLRIEKEGNNYAGY